MIDKETLESATKSVTLSTMLLAALDNLDYKTFCDSVDEENIFANILDIDTKDAMTETEFEEMKKQLSTVIGMAALPSVFTCLGESLKILDDLDDIDDGDESDDESEEEPTELFKTVARIKKKKSKSKDEKRINLTGQPEIDAEIIFNMVKRHNK